MILDEHYWQNRYLNGLTGWELGHVSKPIKQIIDSLNDPNLSILIPGAGNSYEAEYLIHKGFTNVNVLDISRRPLDSLIERIGCNRQLNVIHEDYFHHKGCYDLILEQTFFCAIDPSLREKYVLKASELLNTNGVIEGVLFDFENSKKEPPFSGSKMEYLNLFEKKFEILRLERCLSSEISRKNMELIIKLKKNG